MYKNDENATKSVGGRIILLMNDSGDCCPLAWKSKTIQQVCKSVKSAETRSLDLGMEDTIFLSKMMAELYFGKTRKIPHMKVRMKIDSKTLYDSINSLKRIDEKTIRHLISWIKEQKDTGAVYDISWVSSTDMLADIFTKKNANSLSLVTAVTRGNIQS